MADLYDPDRFEVSYCNLFCEPNKESSFNRILRENGSPDRSISGNQIIHLPKIIARLVSLFKREQFDIVHTHLTHATFIGWIAIRIAGKPRFITSHHYTNDIFRNSDITPSRRFAARLCNYAARHADQVIAVSEAVKKDLLTDGCEATKIKVIHNGIDLAAFDKRYEQTSGDLAQQWQGGHVLATVGSLTERKGHHIAIRAMKRILQQFPEAVLLIVGSGELRKSLGDLAYQLNISENIFFLGFQSNVPSNLKLCDLYVHPALQEPFGIAVLEAMAARKCVIATNVGGVPEIIVDRKTGFLIAPDDPDLLADSVCQALSDPSGATQMGLAGRQRVVNFDIKNVVAAYQEIYATHFREARGDGSPAEMAQ